MNEKKLYIPYGLNIDTEWWDGCGKKQKPQIIIGAVIIISLSIIIGAIYGIIIGLMIIILGGFIVVTVVTKDKKLNLSMLDYICIIIRNSKSQQKYFYKYVDDYNLIKRGREL